MAWTYKQRTGEVFRDGKMLGRGYSGHDIGQNNPELEAIPSVGPIPRGQWGIFGPPMETPTHGPYVLRLAPKPGTEVFGRSGFLIHGDSVSAPGTASLGCIILPRPMRQLIWESDDHDLEVV